MEMRSALLPPSLFAPAEHFRTARRICKNRIMGMQLMRITHSFQTDKRTGRSQNLPGMPAGFFNQLFSLRSRGGERRCIKMLLMIVKMRQI